MGTGCRGLLAAALQALAVVASACEVWSPGGLGLQPPKNPTTVDGAASTITLTYGNTIDQAGSITEWSYLAGATGKAVLQVWRHGSSKTAYTLICSVDAETTAIGVQTVAVVPPCEVQEGDFPGFWQSAHGVVAVRYPKDAPDHEDAFLMTAQAVGVTVEPKPGQSFTVPDITNIPYSKRNYAAQITICGSMWGTTFLAAVVLAGAVYTIGGVAMGQSTGGSRGGGGMLSAHPHYPLWKDISQLFADGVAYSRARVLQEPSGASAGYSRAQDGDIGSSKSSKSSKKSKKSSQHGDRR